MRPRASRPAGPSGGFTLVEMLAVMTIIIVLLALIVPASTGIGQGFNVTAAGQAVADQLTFARQTALELNRSAEVRFYKLKSNSTGNLVFYGMQVWKQVSVQEAVSYQAVNHITYLPIGLKLLEDVGGTVYSPLVDANTFSTYKNTDNLPLNAAAGSYYMAVRFRATGDPEATLTSSTNYVTVTTEQESGTSTPKNFFTVQIDPLTGRAVNYRP